MDLVSGLTYWTSKNAPQPSHPTLAENLECDVLIIGGGISGALLAWMLVEAGVDTVLLDRRAIGAGSTAACTALLAYETDVPLHRLIRKYGEPRAVRSYCACRDAIDTIARVIRRLGASCDFERTESVYLASRRAHVAGLERECAVRAQHGFAVELWSRRRLAAESSLRHAAALVSHDAAQLDPLRLTHALIAAAIRRGLRGYERTEVTRFRRQRGGGLRAFVRGGVEVRARKIALAVGYEAGRFLRRSLSTLHSTYALVTKPLARLPGWPGRRLIWETARPYRYLRTTPDQRVIIGGGDEPFQNPRARDALLDRKTAALQRSLHRWFPAMETEVDYAWTGTFAETTDSLPYIGVHPDCPDLYVALGYGGNGVLFSAIAAEIIRDLHLGRGHRDAELFAFDR